MTEEAYLGYADVRRLSVLSRGLSVVARKAMKQRKKQRTRHLLASPLPLHYVRFKSQLQAVAFTRKGEPVVWTTQEGLQIVDPATRKTRSIKNAPKVGWVCDLCTRGDRELIIPDYEANKVHVLDIESGLIILQFTSHSPLSTWVDEEGDGSIFITDNKGKRISVHDKTGKLTNSFGEDAAFSSPCGIVVSREANEIFVSDPNLALIVVFDLSTLKMKRMIGQDFLMQPVGLELDARGNLLVGEFGRARVSILDLQGHSLGHLADGKLPQARIIKMRNDGRLFVTSSGPEALVMF